MSTAIRTLSLCTALLCLVFATKAQQRSIENVISIIENTAPQLLRDGQNAFKSKSFGQKKEMIVASSKIKSLESLYTGGQDEAFYVYNASGGGFMIVSADERMQPVLGYADNGSFNTDSLPPNVKAWMAGYVAEANRPTVDTPAATTAGSARSKGFSAASTSVGPLVTSEWGQRYPYNELCPTLSSGQKAVTGCVATVMAQVMYYYKSPTVGQGTNSYTTATNRIEMTRDFGAVPFSWSLMKDSYSSSEDDETVQAIANLMLSCGVAANMDYDTESGSSLNNLMSGFLAYFGYDSDMALVSKDYMPVDDWHSLLLAQLDNRCPLPISATSVKGYGHAFLIDGYRFDGDDYPYYHVNWGWNGQDNGYFLMSDMTPSSYADDTFCRGLEVVINAKPDNGTEELQSFLQAVSLTPSAQSVDLTQNEKLSFSLGDLINHSCRTFNGSLVVSLKDKDGSSTDVFSMSVNNLTPHYYIPAHTIQCDIPSAVKSGDYTVEVYAIPQGSSTRGPVTIGNDPGTISITNAENIFFPSVMTQDIHVEDNGSNNMTLTAYTIMNARKDTDFSGSLQMAVADYTGSLVTTFGDVRSISSGLSYLAYYTDDFIFSGTLPTTIQDGAYRLCLGANQSGYSNWSYVQKYTLDGGYISELGLDAFTKFWVHDGKAVFSAPFAAGDVNHDGYIDITDLSKLARLSGSGYTTKDLTFWSADLNEDGILDSTDVTALATSVLNATDFKDNSSAGELLTAEIIEHCGTPYLIIGLNNPANQFNALQFDIEFPVGLETADGAALTFSSRAANHSGTVSNKRVLIFSPSDDSFTGTEGAIAYFPLKFIDGETLDGTTLSLRNIVLSDSMECQAVSADNVTVDLQESLPGLAGAIAKVDAYPRGDKLGQYHADESFDKALEEARTLASTTDADILKVKDAIAAISTDNMVINTPSEGQFIHIKDSEGNYMTCRNTGDNRIEFSSAKDEATVFCYYGGNRLVAYQTGFFAGNTGGTDYCPVNTTEVTDDNASLYYGFVSSPVSIGKYLVAFGDGTHYMSAGGNAGTFSSPSDLTDTSYGFTLEETDAVPVTISSEGMSTLFSPVPLEIPASVKAYAGQYSSEDNTIRLTALYSVIPANTGVLLEGEPNTVCTLAPATASAETTASCLAGSVPAISNTADAYTLQVVDGRLGFFRYTGTTLCGFKAYFPAGSASPSAVAGKGFVIVKDGDDADGIHGIAAPAGNGIVYDLSGKAVASPVKGGIYIIDGKKIRK